VTAYLSAILQVIPPHVQVTAADIAAQTGQPYDTKLRLRIDRLVRAGLVRKRKIGITNQYALTPDGVKAQEENS
jgi:predicted transcriptional regulator